MLARVLPSKQRERSNDVGAYRLFDVCSVKLELADKFQLESCVCVTDPMRPSVVAFAAGRVFLFRFSFDRAPDVLVKVCMCTCVPWSVCGRVVVSPTQDTLAHSSKVEEIKWTYGVPTFATFLR